jgi:hypothetical protein
VEGAGPHNSSNNFLVVQDGFLLLLFIVRYFFDNSTALESEWRSVQTILPPLVHDYPELESVELPGENLGGRDQAFLRGVALHLGVSLRPFQAGVQVAATPLQAAEEAVLAVEKLVVIIFAREKARQRRFDLRMPEVHLLVELDILLTLAAEYLDKSIGLLLRVSGGLETPALCDLGDAGDQRLQRGLVVKA